MSEQIKHECGLALVRLLKPLDFYKEKYGTPLYGLNKMQILMQKQRNRGQDGAGLATIKLDIEPGKRYISRKRTNSAKYLEDLFTGIMNHFKNLTPEQLQDGEWLKDNLPYTGELLMGHLRYGTHGKNTIETVHPFLRTNNYISRNLSVCGNFNLTNVDELFSELVELGQFPKEKSDTVTVMEKIGHFLDAEVQLLFDKFKSEGVENSKITKLIAEHLDVQRILQRAFRKFDGGYVMAGLIGHGDAFVVRDPNGIRPAFYYQNDEVVVVASERPAIQSAFGVHKDEIKELPRGNGIIIKKNGHVTVTEIREPQENKACSFERIYFSRGNDADIYQERKMLGKLLVEEIMEELDHDIENAIFSFIPNTAEVSYYGMVEGLRSYCNELKKRKFRELGPNPTDEELNKVLAISPRIEKIAIKDAKLRTFIADDSSRGDLVNLVYDVTHGVVKEGVDTLVLIDDSIVRGTTLRDSILANLSRTNPKKIIIVSSAPQIRYPDCYGIDMSKMKSFVAFNALVEMLKESGQENRLQEAYEKCLAEEQKPMEEMTNQVQWLYDLFPYSEVSQKIAEMLTPENMKPDVSIIYQTVENLHKACPDNTGDWYFSGNYPTPGGTRVVNRSFINFMEKNDQRAY